MPPGSTTLGLSARLVESLRTLPPSPEPSGPSVAAPRIELRTDASRLAGLGRLASSTDALAGAGTRTDLGSLLLDFQRLNNLDTSGVLDLNTRIALLAPEEPLRRVVGEAAEPVRLPSLELRRPDSLVGPPTGGDPHARAVQEALRLAGFYTGPTTGIYDEPTAAATRRFQESAGLPPDGTLTEDDWLVLLGMLPEDLPDSLALLLYPVRWRSASLQAPPTPPLIRKGNRGPVVAFAQLLLGMRGHPTTIDGDFGPNTDGMVRQLQRVQGLEADGIVGPMTWGLLLRDLDVLPTDSPAAVAVVAGALAAFGIEGAESITGEPALSDAIKQAQLELELGETGLADRRTLVAILVALEEDADRRALRQLINHETEGMDPTLQARVRPVLSAAVSCLGAKEWDAVVRRIIEGFFPSHVPMEQRHWCALSVSLWIRDGLGLESWDALPFGRRVAAVRQIAFWASERGLLRPPADAGTILPGELFVMPRAGNTHSSLQAGEGSGHTGLVLADLGTAVHTIEGNTSDAVHQRFRDKAELTGFVRWWEAP